MAPGEVPEQHPVDHEAAPAAAANGGGAAVPNTQSLRGFLARLIWACVLPLVLLALYLASDHLHILQGRQQREADNHLHNVKTALDRNLASRIAALQVLAASPLLDDLHRLEAFYREALGYREHFGGQVIVADPSSQMLLNTRVTLGTPLPRLPRPKGHAAAPTVLATGKPAVGDRFHGPIAQEPLVAVVVPVTRAERTTALLLSILDTQLLQQRLDLMALPAGWWVTLRDGNDQLLARHAPSATAAIPDPADGIRLVARLELAPWSVVLTIPRDLVRGPLVTATTALAVAILAVTVISVAGGRWARRRLAQAMASLTTTTVTGDRHPRIAEIEAVRTLLADTATGRELARQAQRESEAEYRVVLDSMLEGCQIVDFDWRYLYINPAAERQNRRPTAELLGRTMLECWPDADLTQFFTGARQCLEQRTAQRLEYDFRYPDGLQARYRINLQPVPEGIAIFSEDVTEQRRLEALREAERDLFELIASGQPLAALLGAIAHQAEALMPGALCSILLLDADRHHVHHGAAPSLPSGFTAAIDGEPIGPRAGSCGTAMYRNEPVIVSDLTNDPLWSDYRDLALHHGLRACWSLPIDDRTGAVLGSFALYYRAPRTPTPADLDLVQRFAHLAGIGIERQHAEEALRAGEAQLRFVTDHAPVLIAQCGPDRCYRFVNRPYAALFGLQPADLIGQHPRELLGEAAYAVAEPHMAAVLAGQTTTYEVELPAVQDGPRVFRACYVPEHDESDRVVGFIAAILDISERRAAEAEIRRLNAELEQRVLQRTAQLAAANRELETFAYSVSHDLKAPLRGVDGYSRILEEEYGERLDAEGRKLLANIRQGALLMHQLIEDLLAYSRLERRVLQVTPVDLPELVRDVTVEFTAETAQAGVRIESSVPALQVLADRDGLATVLRNLIGNALKFSRGASTPTVAIGARPEEGKALLWVRDNGIGFDMRYHDRIFELFQRLERSEEYAGTGIGLALVRKAVERMGGRVWAESTPGAGATFYVEIPVS